MSRSEVGDEAGKAEFFEYAGSARLSKSGKMVTVHLKGVRKLVFVNVENIEAVLHDSRPCCSVVVRKLGSS